MLRCSFVDVFAMPVSRHRLLRNNIKPKTTATPTGLAVAVPTGLAVAMNAATSSSCGLAVAESSAVYTEVSSDDELSSRLGDLMSRPAKKRNGHKRPKFDTQIARYTCKL